MGKLNDLTRAGARLPAAALGHLKHAAAGSAKKRGVAPGTVIYVGLQRDEPVRLAVLDYDTDFVEEEGPEEPQAGALTRAQERLDGPHTTWINVDGLHEVDVIESLGKHIGLHRLVMEDIVHTAQRAKVEEYPEHVYIVLRMLDWEEGTDVLRDEQVSLVLGAGYVVSFQERAGDVFAGVRDRLRQGRGTIRTRRADYLAYALMDSVVDHYFGIIERVSDRIERLELAILEDPEAELVQEVHRLKRDMVLVRRAVWPLREVVAKLYRDDIPFIEDETRVFLRDVHDHAVQVIDTVESLRDLLGGLMDLHLTGVSNRMNEVMKVLTIIATIFIPLSFVAGVYGMNFDLMPELHVAWGYPAALSLMAIMAGGMLVYFRRKGWF